MANETKKMTAAEMEAKLAAMQAALDKAEAARLEAEEKLKGKQRAISCKVSDKGAVSVYGLGRFPVTLYEEQWKRLSEAMAGVLTFCEENHSKLSQKKGDPRFVKPTTPPVSE